MSHQEQIIARTDELTDTVQAVVDAFRPYRADHRPDQADFDRWLIWNDQTCRREPRSILALLALTGVVPGCERRILTGSALFAFFIIAFFAGLSTSIGIGNFCEWL